MTRSSPVSLPIASTLHTSEVSMSCPHAAVLRLEGKTDRDVPTALYRGLFAGALLQETLPNERCVQDHHLTTAAAAVADQIEKENRVPTDAVLDKLPEIHTEVAAGVNRLIDRFGARIRACRYIGHEVPISIEMPGDGEVIDFKATEMPSGRFAFDPPFPEPRQATGFRIASHLDYLMRDTDNVWGRGENALICPDWKWVKESPTHDYLGRWLQGAIYWYAGKHGQFLIDGDWVTFDQHLDVSWIQLPATKAYGKAGIYRNDEGNEQEYKRGDDRPERAIWKWTYFREDREDLVVKRIRQWRDMMLSGLDVPIPDKIGCSFCGSRSWCQRYDTAPVEGE